MRKVIGTAAALMMVAGALSGVASAAPKQQSVEGSILIPQPGAALGNCNYRPQRTLMIAAGEQINGIVGHTFEVDPATAGKKFKLEVAGAGVGMDIVFYTDLGNADPQVAPGNTGYETPGPGGEDGTVPAGYKFGFVCMSEGSNGTFTYTAGKGVK